jgi:receptor expression-enhancing protein 5/6
VWYPVKLLFVAWLALPQFKGASFIYEKFVRDQLRKYRSRARKGDSADHKVHILKVTTKSVTFSALIA